MDDRGYIFHNICICWSDVLSRKKLEGCDHKLICSLKMRGSCPHWHFGEQRYRVKFKLLIHEIRFTRNEYFLKNSSYTIYQANHKKQQSIRTRTVLKIGELAKLQVNKSITFSTTLFQDLPCKYLEKYIPNNRRIVIRQRTKVNGCEYLVRDIGYIELPLHELVFGESPVHYEYDLYDPDDEVEAVISLSIEFKMLPTIPIQPKFYFRFGQCLWKSRQQVEIQQHQCDRHSVNQEHFDVLRKKSDKVGVYDYHANKHDIQTMSPNDLDLLSQHRQQSILKRQGSPASPYRYTLGSFQQDLVELNPNSSPLGTNDQLKRLANSNMPMQTDSEKLSSMRSLGTQRNSKLWTASPGCSDISSPSGFLRRPLPGTPSTPEDDSDSLELTPSPPGHLEVHRQMPSRKDTREFFDFRRSFGLSAIDGSDNEDLDSHSLSYSRSNVTSSRIASCARSHSYTLGAISSSGSTSENDLLRDLDDDEPNDGELRFPPTFAADVSAVQFIGEGISQSGTSADNFFSRYFFNNNGVYNNNILLRNFVFSPNSPTSPVFSRLNEDKGDSSLSMANNNRFTADISSPNRTTEALPYLNVEHDFGEHRSQLAARTVSIGHSKQGKSLHDFGMIPMLSGNDEPIVGESTTADLSQSKEATPMKKAELHAEDVDDFSFGAAYYEFDE